MVTVAFNPRELVAALADAGVDYVVIGGLFGTDEFGAEEFPFGPLDPGQLAAGGNFLLLTRHGRLDMMQWVPGIGAEHAYEHLRAHAVKTRFADRTVLVCSREDLIAMKRAAGRPQDLDDLRALGA